MKKSPSYFDALYFSIVSFIIGKNDSIHGSTNYWLVLSATNLFYRSMIGYYKVFFLVLSFLSLVENLVLRVKLLAWRNVGSKAVINWSELKHGHGQICKSRLLEIPLLSCQ